MSDEKQSGEREAIPDDRVWKLDLSKLSFQLPKLTRGSLCMTVFGHDWEVQQRGHKCARCGIEEWLDENGQKWVADPSMPKDELRMVDSSSGKILGIIKNVRVP